MKLTPLSTHILNASLVPKPRRCAGCWFLFGFVAVVLVASYARWWIG